MAVFFDNSITDVGRQLWAEMQAGGSFTPTRIVIGSGYMPASKTSRTMTAVAEPVQSIELNKAQAQPDGDYIFGGAFSNKDVAQAFYYRELALYAKVKRADGTETAETLYSYGNAGENAELIPAYGAGTVVEKQLDLLVYIGNDAEVTVNISTGVYVDREEFNEAIASITPEKIGALPVKLPVISDVSVKSITQPGRYYCFNCTDIPAGESNYGYLDVFVHHDDPDYRYLRYKSSINMNSLSFECICDDGTWTEWVQAYSVYNKPHPTEINAVSLGKDRTEIPENADLNNYLHIGGFRCSVTETALTLKNCPVPVAFIMDVVSATGNEEEIDVNDFRYLMQRVYSFNGTEYFRLVSSKGTGVITYGEWEHKYSSYQPPTPAEIGAYGTLGLVKEADLVAWANAQTIGGSFMVSPANTTVNVPENHWYFGLLEVSNDGKRMTLTGLNTYKQYVNITRNGNFAGWVEQFNSMNPPTTAGGVVPATVE